MVGIDSVTVCNIKVVKNSNPVDENIVTARRMKCPKRSINNSKFLKCNVIAFFNIDDGWAWIKVACYIIPILTLNKGVTVSINSTLTADSAIIRLVGIDKYKARLACYRVADKCGFGVVYQFIWADISVNVACSL